jgi:hypothetical protein
MEELLPGLTDQLVADGAVPGDILDNVRWYLRGGRMLRQRATGRAIVSASRPLIEAAVRARVVSLPNVAVVDGYDIAGLVPSLDRRRITGVRVSDPQGRTSRTLQADLVVDATGRASRTPRWLVELGYAAPAEDRMDIGLWYATRLFDRAAGPFGDDVVVVSGRYPGQRRGGVMQRLENDRVLVTLTGVLDDRPPLDLAGFTAFARELSRLDTHELARAATPVGEPRTFRIPTYVRRRYERLTAFPSGLPVTATPSAASTPSTPRA